MDDTEPEYATELTTEDIENVEFFLHAVLLPHVTAQAADGTDHRPALGLAGMVNQAAADARAALGCLTGDPRADEGVLQEAMTA